ncbi:hypothetical protein AFE_2418 [Acidithiobacillus ferrooxidans ATCC 23270]|uniref:Uncharacterized protein n=1 Tax=Acidithiobacillus ferrooxidans (strain ATCC 23270 / DSM 14882 / CIP 104768 / NCIMB 8455) TaxID=243159 RepID=B7J6V8_ACIF2|nr:hypothetical protein AFE_2418 [Acidithiobacillus ferrooxidans ATCC 23270]
MSFMVGIHRVNGRVVVLICAFSNRLLCNSKQLFLLQVSCQRYTF